MPTRLDDLHTVLKYRRLLDELKKFLNELEAKKHKIENETSLTWTSSEVATLLEEPISHLNAILLDAGDVMT